MPHAPEFLRGFNLVRGTTFDGFTLIDVMATHNTVKQYSEYSYDITLTFRANSSGASYNNLYYSLLQTIRQTHIIYGVRNPYSCTIDIPQDGSVHQIEQNTYLFNLKGHAYRKY